MASLGDEKSVKSMNLTLGAYHDAGKGIVGAAGEIGTTLRNRDETPYYVRSQILLPVSF